MILTKMIELQILDLDVIIRLWNPDFAKQATVINKDAHISVWKDVKLYVLLIIIFAITVISMMILSLIKCIRGSLTEGLQIVKTKFVWDYSIQFFYMAYLKLCMTDMNQIDLSSRNSYYWKATDSDWAIAIGILLVSAPAGAFYFLWKSEDLEEK